MSPVLRPVRLRAATHPFKIDVDIAALLELHSLQFIEVVLGVHLLCLYVLVLDCVSVVHGCKLFFVHGRSLTPTRPDLSMFSEDH